MHHNAWRNFLLVVLLVRECSSKHISIYGSENTINPVLGLQILSGYRASRALIVHAHAVMADNSDYQSRGVLYIAFLP